MVLLTRDFLGIHVTDRRSREASSLRTLAFLARRQSAAQHVDVPQEAVDFSSLSVFGVFANVVVAGLRPSALIDADHERVGMFRIQDTPGKFWFAVRYFLGTGTTGRPCLANAAATCFGE